MTIEETEEEKNARVAAVIHERLTAELSLPLYDETTQIDAFAFLNATSVVSTVTKPIPVGLDALIGMLSAASFSKVFLHPSFTDLRDKILATFQPSAGAMEFMGVELWLQGLLKAGFIEQIEFDKVQEERAKTQEVQTVTPIQARSWDIIRGIPGGPNVVSEEQFAAAWLAAGRS